jgi:class 3 adenylate cyclase
LRKLLVRRGEFQYRWRWDLEAEPAALWPVVADTNRFNLDAGVPALQEEGVGHNARRRLRFSRLGIAVAWEEEPFEWVEPHRFSVRRRYQRGPLAEMDVTVELSPRPDGGTALAYEVRARPRNALGWAAIPVQIGLLSRRRFEATFRRYDRLALAREAPAPTEVRARLVPGGERRLEAAKAALLAEGLNPELVDRLAVLVGRGDELAAARVRPYALAGAWGAERRAVLELCLHATRAGLLELRWDLLCPLCRRARQSAGSLAVLESKVHCDTCQIDFSADFARSVELAFRPCAAVREVDDTSFCIAGPQVTPHVTSQQLLAPGDSREIRPELDQGHYRVRALGQTGFLPILVDTGGTEDAVVHVTGSWPAEELRLAATPALRLQNDTGREQLVILERTAWSDDAVTAAEVTALQLFRDLFSMEALRPAEPISVGTLTVLFTDLRDSTRFYREVGDAPAFGTVMDHLDVLRSAVADEDGAVVKAMGDAIMAVFRRPLPALRAALTAQRAVAVPREGGRPLALKVGIHAGPCIAVTQNGLLDYFGSTVNLAARLVPLSSGADVVVSETVLADPEIRDLVGGERLTAEPLEATLKGFEDERFQLWRVCDAEHGRAQEAHAAAAR